MSTVHTEYGPGRIIAQETVRGRTRFKVAGEGFEVWLDQTKLGGYEPPAEIDFSAPHWEGHNLDDGVVYPEPIIPLPDTEYADPRLDRARLRTHPDYLSDDDPDARFAHRRQAGPVDDYADNEMRGLRGGDYEGYDPDYDPRGEYRHLEYDPGLSFDDDPDLRHAKRVMRGKSDRPSRLAWAPLDDDNSTALPYNPDPQHDAINTSGDDGSATLQPIHHIDADERLSPADSIDFDDADDGEEPGPNPDLFAKQSWVSPNMTKGVGQTALDALGLSGVIDLHQVHDKLRDKVRNQVIQRTHNPGLADKAVKGIDGGLEGGSAAGAIAAGEYAISRGLDRVTPGYDTGWGRAIKPASVHEANPLLLALPAAAEALGGASLGEIATGLAGRAAGGAALHGLMSGGEHAADALSEATEPGNGWDDAIHEASYRPAGLSDRYIDITAGADYHNDPVAQFRHDPDAYINRIGHLMDEGLNPRFAEYMDLVEADQGIRTAAWKDVRKKAMRLKREGHVTVKDLAPNRIMASVVGDHGTYDVLILKNGSYGGLGGGSHAITNWHCGCEWGKWAFRRKFTFVGRLCSHAYASYLTMQSAHMTNQPRLPRQPNRKAPSRALPFLHVKRADTLQDGPKRLVPELAVNDTDDAQMFLDVTKDERTDTGPDDVVSEKDIVHFARLMRHCEVTESPYPRELVAFLNRYADCADDVITDFHADDADDADAALSTLRSDADRDQEGDFGSMADRVHRIQDAVEEARDNGADASRFVAMVRKLADDTKNNQYSVSQDGGRTLYRGPNNKGYSLENGTYTPVDFTGKGDQGAEGNRYKLNPDAGTYTRSTENGRDLYRRNDDSSYLKDRGFAVQNGDVRGVNFTGEGEQGGKQRFDYNGDYTGNQEDFQNFLKNNPNAPKATTPATFNNDQSGMPVGVGFNEKPSEGKPGTSQNQSGSGNNSNGGGGGNGGGGKSSGGGGGGGYQAPGGGMTSGNVADGGRPGAENGNNSSIGKDQLDADGYYTVQKGDTLSDIAQRAYGDMNKYQDLAKGNSIANPDVINEGQRIKIDNPTGNGGLSGDKTNPADGGSDKNIATPETPKVDTSAVSGGSTGGTDSTPAPAAPEPAQQPAAPKPESQTIQNQDGSTQSMTDPGLSNPKPPTTASAKAWLRWAADGDGSSTNQTADSTTQSDTASASSNPVSGPAAGTGSRSAPATNPAQTGQPGSPSKSETYDPADPAQVQQQSMNAANPGAQAGGSNSLLPSSGTGGGLGTGLGDVGSMIGQGVGMASDIASGLGGALPGLASGIGNAISGIGSIFASKEDFDDWRRYAYPIADGEGDLKPHTHPFAGSGYPGSLEFTTSEEYADKARKKHDDVTDLGSGDLTKPMKEWQKQSSRRLGQEWNQSRNGPPGWNQSDFIQNWAQALSDHSRRQGLSPEEALPSFQELVGGPWDDQADLLLEHVRQHGLSPEGRRPRNPMLEDDEVPPDFPGHDGREASIGYSTDDDSDIVRTFQAHLGETALGAGAGQGAGRFDDFAGAAQGFLRTAGRNYSLAEQSELIREGDKGGARNLDSLDLKGTHYEDMQTLGW